MLEYSKGTDAATSCINIKNFYLTVSQIERAVLISQQYSKVMKVQISILVRNMRKVAKCENFG